MTTTTAIPPAIDLSGLVKTFRGADGPVRAVDGVDARIEPAEIVALLGPNGAGKTTTIDMLLGLTAPTAGTAAVFGLPPREAVERGRVSAVLQSGGLLRDLTVAETVTMIASVTRRPCPPADVLARAGLTGLANRRVAACSGGEQQRLRFALALLPDPDLIVLDEPTAGMDVGGRRAFWDTMRADAAAGRTVVFATHYLEEADAFAERIVLMSGGRVVADGTAAEIRARASGRTVSADLPDAGRAGALERLAALPGVSDVSVTRGRVHVRAADSDAVARALLTGLGGAGLEIRTESLEDAFLEITGGDAEKHAQEIEKEARR